MTKDGLTDEENWMIKQITIALPEVLPLPEPDRSRALLGLAYEYFIMDMEERAFEILEKADPNYFGEQLGKDMKSMSDMKTIVMRIMDKLVECGIVKLEVK